MLSLRFSGPLALAVALVLLVVPGCDIFEVKNPGRILDEDLNSERVMDALVVGMSSDYAQVLDDLAFIVARLSDEMEASGSYFLSTRARFGIIEHEDTDFYWNNLHEARFVAENGIERMQEVLGENFDGNPLTARAYLFAGVANRTIGENFCQVTYDGSAPLEPTAAFERAIGFLDDAINQAQQAGNTALLNAAYGARAQAHVGTGNWSAAVADAQQVPIDFVYVAPYSANSGRENNEVFDETHQRYEMSAFAALAGSFEQPDPRAPYTDCRVDDDCSTSIGADGSTPHLRQEKYNEIGSDIPIVTGAEMRLIEAEAALRDGDLGTALAKMNEVRAYYQARAEELEDTADDPIDFRDLEPLEADAIGAIGDADPDDGWSLLDQERHLTLWLEGRRLFDLRRWDHPFLNGGTLVYEGIDNRAACLPIADSECQTNPNVTCN